MSVLEACRACKKIVCMVACTPEIEAEWVRLDAKQEERERQLRFEPPRRATPAPRPDFRGGVAPKLNRYRPSRDDLR